MGLDVGQLPSGLPFNGAVSRGGEDPEREWRKRAWYVYLRFEWIGSNQRSWGVVWNSGSPSLESMVVDLPISIVNPLTESLIG